MPVKGNIFLGFIGGVIGALLGAVLWGGIIALTHWQIGVFAIAVGFFAGFGVRILGNGSSVAFGVVGAVLAMLGCLVGEILSVAFIMAQQMEISFVEALDYQDEIVAFIIKESFSMYDIVFYAIAMYAGFTYSRVEENAPATPTQQDS